MKRFALALLTLFLLPGLYAQVSTPSVSITTGGGVSGGGSSLLPLGLPDGTACSAPSLFQNTDPDSGLNFAGTAGTQSTSICRNNSAVYTTDATNYANIAGSLVVRVASPFEVATFSTGEYCFTSGAIGAASDTCYARVSAGVSALTSGPQNTRRSLFGGGAAVASATALPVPTGRVFHVTGTTVITSITSTNFQAGVCITMIFDGITTLTDGSNLVLAGNFVTTADDTWSGCYDGTNWYESSRSVN